MSVKLHVYGAGPFTHLPGSKLPRGQAVLTAAAVDPDPLPPGDGSSSCMQCFDHRVPSMTTVVRGDTRKGYLPAGSYGFTQEGAVVDLTTGAPHKATALNVRVTGPVYGATMGSAVPRASQSYLNNLAGFFNPLPSAQSRGCYV